MLKIDASPSLPAVSATAPLRQVMACIDAAGRGIALVVDGQGRLEATITDGDVRRAMLAGLDLDDSAAKLLATRPAATNRPPVTAPASTPPVQLLRLMSRHSVRQIPLLAENGCVGGLVTVDDLLPQLRPQPQAVVMAGGFGTRLRPLTDHVPKPMLPIGGRPLLEHIVNQLRDAEVLNLSLTTHYKSEVIRDHFGDGSRFGVHISYVNEDRPLGTAGALGLMPPWATTLIVVNGDILTGTNFGAMLAFHREHQSTLTVGVRQYEMMVPYGVMDIDGVRVRRLDEKPRFKFFVNAGIYMLEPEVHAQLVPGEHIDMTTLIERLMAAEHRVVSFPISEYWLDIGRLDDYERAQQEFSEGRIHAMAS